MAARTPNDISPTHGYLHHGLNSCGYRTIQTPGKTLTWQGTRAVRMVLSGRLRGTYRQSGGTDRNKTEKDKRLECRYFEDIEVLTAKAAK